MSVLKGLNPFAAGNKAINADTTAPEDAVTPVGFIANNADDKEARAGLSQETTEIRGNTEETPGDNAQSGVQKIEAVTLAWSKKSVAFVLCFIWLLTLVNGFQSTVAYSLNAYVTSDFQSHSLLAVIDIVANTITAAVYIPIAKMIDIWGRAEGFLLMVGFCLLGLILMAASQNLPTYCAAQVFYSIGFGGVSYCWVVLSADVTNLRNRGLAFAFTSSPGLITAFAGSKAAEGFNKVNWRWGFGTWAIVFPVIAFPLYVSLAYHLRKAKKLGLLTRQRSNRTFTHIVWYAITEFDLPGVILLGSGFVVFLLPFTLATTAPQGWQTDYIIAMIVVGFVLLVLFFVYEVYLAPVPFLNNRFLLDRTVLGACLLDMTYQVSYACYSAYFTSFLQVVFNVDVATAGYVGNVFSVVSFVFLFITGWLIRYTGRYKWILWICVPLYLFGLGLMIHFRQPNGNIGYIVMCEIFFSIPGGIFILVAQLAVLAVVDHQHVAAVLAVLYVSGTIGGSVGSAVSGAIWTNTFEKALERYLPASAVPDIATIYQDLPTQLSYAVGSPERLAIQKAYGYAQTRMLAAGTSIMVLAFVWVGMLRNINVKNMSQTKGNVF